MSAHEEYVDDIALLALDALTGSEAAAVRSHLATCDECAGEYGRLREVADVLPLSASSDAAAPSARIKRRVLEIPAGPRAIGSRPRPIAAYAFAAACLAAAIVMGVFYSQLNARIAQQNAIIADLTSPASQHYAIVRGQVVRSGSDVYIAMRDLPAPPAGKTYQAWTLPAGSKRMAPSVTFAPKNGSVLLRLPVDARGIVAVAVSIEPAGGSPQPTSKPVFVVLLKAPKA